MSNAERKRVRIELTADQRRQVQQVIGRDAVAVEVGSDDPDDEWVVLVRVPASVDDDAHDPEPRCGLGESVENQQEDKSE